MAASVRGKSVAWLSLVLLVLVVAGGCVSETKAGDKTIITYEWWVPLSVMVGGIVAAPGRLVPAGVDLSSVDRPDDPRPLGLHLRLVAVY